MNFSEVKTAKNKLVSRSDENAVVTTDAAGNALSHIFDDIWDFSQCRSFSNVVEQRKISFENIPLKIKVGIQSTLAMFVANFPTLSVNTLMYKRGHLVRLAKSLGSCNWDELDSDEVFRHFKSDFKQQGYSNSTAKGSLITLNQLFQLRLTTRYLNDVKRWSAELSSEDKQVKQQHIAIPESMAIKIFRNAENVVNKYYPHRHAISAAYGHYFQVREQFLKDNPTFEPKRFWATVGLHLKHNVPLAGFEVRSNSDDLDLIKTACLILILGYSGVRHGEGLSVARDGYGEKTYHGFSIPFINGLVTKVNDSGIPTEECWITHPIVKDAIELLYDCTEFAREIYREQYSDTAAKMEVIEVGLLSTDIARHRSSVRWSAASLNIWLNRYLRIFDIKATSSDVIEFDKVNPSRKGQMKEGGFLPKLSSHDFRRTFAVFLTRNQLGNIMTLKRQYKHLNVLMAQWYAQNSHLASMLDIKVDTDLQHLISEANVTIMTETIYEVYNSPTLSGGEGERIAHEREKKSYSGTIYTSKQEIERQIRDGTLSVVEHPTGFCFNPTCSRICASNISSLTCKHEAVTAAKASELAEKRVRLVSKYNNLISLGNAYRSIRNRLYVDIKAIELTLSKHDIPFQTFVEYSA